MSHDRLTCYLVHTSTLSCPKLMLGTKIVDENKVGTKSVNFFYRIEIKKSHIYRDQNLFNPKNKY